MRRGAGKRRVVEGSFYGTTTTQVEECVCMHMHVCKCACMCVCVCVCVCERERERESTSASTHLPCGTSEERGLSSKALHPPQQWAGRRETCYDQQTLSHRLDPTHLHNNNNNNDNKAVILTHGTYSFIL